MTDLAANGFLYHGIPRWDFGLESPNKAAILLAFLVILLLAALLRARRGWIMWSCASLAAVIGYALIHTFSRGGFLALTAGCAILLAAAWRNRSGRKRLVPILLVAGTLAACMVWIGFAGRLAQSVPAHDASAGNRLVIWKAVPGMMVDAPGGWGSGNSGDAFMGWYQPLNRYERYRTLVNSHFTWLVEWGWGGDGFMQPVGCSRSVWVLPAWGSGPIRCRSRSASASARGPCSAQWRKSGMYG